MLALMRNEAEDILIFSLDAIRLGIIFMWIVCRAVFSLNQKKKKKKKKKKIELMLQFRSVL